MASNLMSATEASEAIRSGQLTSQELVKDCLDHIAAIEAKIGAWTFLEPDYALTQARAADRAQQAGRSLGALHGLPVGIKDIFDTYDMPTEDGTVLHAGRQPAEDATAVALLRAAGAVIMGKTVTTELAVYAPSKTRNPHNMEHTPGGSSSGSAAAVAAGMLPLALGTQTNGSVIRPASFCGVYGYKPTHGRISRHRVLRQSRPLDQIGVFARTLEDVALLAQQLMVYDDRDPDMRMRPQPALMQSLAAGPPASPRLAFVKTPMWNMAEVDTREALAELVAHLDGHCDEIELPTIFNDAVEQHRTIMEADLARSFEREYANGKDKLSAILCEMIERGQRALAVDYNHAVSQIPALNQSLRKIFDRYDAILTPATTGSAPAGLESTGNPIFCTLWTLCGTPAITLPLLKGALGLPLGVQLVGARGDDARLLRTARWLAKSVGKQDKDRSDA